MNKSQFMDKQIMDLSAGGVGSSPSQRKHDFVDFINVQDEHDADSSDYDRDDEILPNYDFQPILPVNFTSQSPNLDDSKLVGGSRVGNSANSKANTVNRTHSSLDSIDHAKIEMDREHYVHEAKMVFEIDRTMKKHADNLIHALEGISARLTQLETRTRQLENSVDDLQVSVGNNHGSADGKMRQLENIIKEVHTNVQFISNNQEKVQAQLEQLTKLQMPKANQLPLSQNTASLSTVPQPLYTPQQSLQQPPPAPQLPQPTLQPPPPQPSHQYPQNQSYSIPQQEPYYQPPGHAQEAPSQQYLVPPTQHGQVPPHAPPHHYQPSSFPQPPPQLPQQFSSLPPTNLPPESLSYTPHQNYPPSLPQQLYGHQSQMYELPPEKSNSSYSSEYGPQSETNNPYSYSGPANQYGKQQRIPSSRMSQGGGDVYQRLPTARVLPQALPTASVVSTGSSSAGGKSRVMVDDVVDQVTSMGFSRDAIRATVRRLTEDGQEVDMNAVLDKLMNG